MIFSNIFIPLVTIKAVSVNEQIGENVHPYAEDYILVKFKPQMDIEAISIQTNLSSLSRSFEKVNAEGLSRIHGRGDLYKLLIDNGTDIKQAVDVLRSEPDVVYAEPDYLARYASVPNDPSYSMQWGLEKVSVEAAWNHTFGSNNVTIAIIDSGIALSHEDLEPNIWTNPGETPNNGTDDDNNGFIDDISGWNFIDSTNDVQDITGHGTMVAGIAAARSNNALGIAGVCGNCRIMPVKVSQVSGFANYSDIASGIYYAVDKGAQIINLSLGGYADSITLKEAIDYANSRNVIVIAGAGNDNSSDPFYPAAYADVLAVAASDADDIKTVSSNFGEWVNITAPGQDILTTSLSGYSNVTGTSFSTPFVSGAAGLLLSLNPQWTAAMVRAQIVNTSDDINSQNPDHFDLLGTGRLNIETSIQDPTPILIYEGYTGNGTIELRPDFGSSVALTVSIRNGWSDAFDVIGTLSSPDPYVTITNNSADFGSILSGESKENINSFLFEIDGDAGYNHSMPFNLFLSANNGDYQTELEFNVITKSSIENVSGTIISDTLWTNDKTYHVTGNVGVAPGYTLTIEPGTNVRFTDGYSLNIGGNLIAKGTAELPILFEPVTVGNDWNQILFDDQSIDAQVDLQGEYLSGNILEHVQISGASGGIACNYSTPFISNISIDDGGLNCSLGDTNLWIKDSLIVGEINISDGGMEAENIIRSTFTNESVVFGSINIDGSQFNEKLTITEHGWINDSTLRSLAIYGRGEIDNIIGRGDIEVGGLSLIANSTIYGGYIFAGENSVITENNIEDTYFTAVTVFGNGTITNNRIIRAEKGIVSGSGIIENNLVAYTSGNGLEPGTSAVRHNTLIGVEGYAVYLTDIPDAFEFNNFVFNVGNYDVYTTVQRIEAETIFASNNWWGTQDEITARGRIYDFMSDYNLATLDIAPILTAPSQTSPAYIQDVSLTPSSPVGIQKVTFDVTFSKPMDVNNPLLTSFEPITTNTWETKSDMPTPRQDLCVVSADNGKIYAIGGYPSLKNVEEYDPELNQWTIKQPMQIGRQTFGAAAANGKIYVMGGFIGGTDSATVEEYDPQTDTWTFKSPMPSARYTLGVTKASNGLIYAIGGHNRTTGKTLAVVEAYDPLTDTWATKASLPYPIDSIQYNVVGSNNGKIYLIGGRIVSDTIYGDNLNVLEYDIYLDKWSVKSPIPSERSSFSLAYSNNKIYAVGGVIPGSRINWVEEYDIQNDTWQEAAAMPTARVFFGLVEGINGRIYAIGGSPKAYSYLSTVEEYAPHGWGNIIINTNPHWSDSIQYSSEYEFTSQNPIGDYKIILDGAMDQTGIMIAPDSRSNFTISYANEIADYPPPPEPDVLAWGDGTLTQLSGRAYVDDPEGLITTYRYAIGTTPGNNDVINWTEITLTNVTRTGLNLQPDQPYFLSFQVRNVGGIWGDVGISNPVVNGSSLPTSILVNLSPMMKLAGETDFTLTVTGDFFIEESVVRWDGVDMPTSFITPTELQALISASDINEAGEYGVTVFTPTPGGGLSNTLSFTVENPVPVITSIDPDSVTAGGTDFMLTVNGDKFTEGSVVRIEGSDRSTNFISEAQLEVQILASDILEAGEVSITVYTPEPGGGLSNAEIIVIKSSAGNFIYLPLVIH